jgi:hypothetical protein
MTWRAPSCLFIHDHPIHPHTHTHDDRAGCCRWRMIITSLKE